MLNCDQQIIDVAELDAIWDIKSWLSPHINTHTNPHNFLFQHGESRKAEMRYRNEFGLLAATASTTWCGALKGQYINNL